MAQPTLTTITTTVTTDARYSTEYYPSTITFTFSSGHTYTSTALNTLNQPTLTTTFTEGEETVTVTETSTIGNATSTSSTSSTTPSKTQENTRATTPTQSGLQSSTKPSSPTPSSEAQSKQFSTGALAGGIVGALIGGFLLAFLAAFLFFRSRRRSTQVAPLEKSAPPREAPGKQPGEDFTQFVGTTIATPHSNDHQQLDLAAIISEPADDGNISTRVQTFFDQASLHIDNFYSRASASPSLSQEAINRLGSYESSFLSASLVSLLAKPQAQRAVLTHVLLQSLMNAIKPEDQQCSLLPANFTLPSQRANGDASNTDEQLIFAWRLLTSHLSSRSGPSPVLDNQIAQFAEEFTQAFEPYSNPQFSPADRLRHLTSVAKAASELGTWLFSQPCTFDFRWAGTTSSQTHVVILPAVVKVGDEKGRRLAVPHVLVEKTVARI